MLWIITTVGPDMQDMANRIGCGRFLAFEQGMHKKDRTVYGHIKRFDPSKGADAAVLPALIEGFIKDLEWEFELRDGDGFVHFGGRSDNMEDTDGDRAFEPLDTFQDDTGCTALFYRKVGQENWSEL